MIEYSELDFNKHKQLMCGNRKTKYSYVKVAEGQFKIKYPDGQLSEDFYNLSRVRDNIRRLYQEEKNNDLKSPNNTTDTASRMGS